MENRTEERCQSCGMPIECKETDLGTNMDGSKNEDYCHYCYQNGDFTQKVNMDEMIRICLPTMKSQKMSEDVAVKMMNEYFPQLKRWKD